MRGIISLIISALSVNAIAYEHSDTLSRVEKLGEVVVKGDNITVTPDKMIVRVDKSVKRHAYDGYSALSLMSIPGLEVSVFDHSVSAFGNSVQLLINGLEATDDEIKTLNPKDIIRIDYYTNYDPRYPTKEYVLDFIMSIRESGGAMMLQSNKSLNERDVDGLADWRTFRGKTELGVRVTGGLACPEGSRGIERMTLQFPAGELVQTDRTYPKHVRSNAGTVKLSLLHRYEHGVLKSAVSMGTEHDRGYQLADMTYSGLRDFYTLSYGSQHSDRLYPSFSLSYDHKYPSGVLLSYSLKGGYTHTDDDKVIRQENSYISHTHESYVNLLPRVKLTVPIGKKVSTYANILYYYDNSLQHYVENGRFQDIRLINGQLLIEAGANVKLHRNTSLTFRMQERVVTTYAGNRRNTESYFTPAVTLSYKFIKGNSMSLRVASGVYDPQLKYYSSEEKRVSDYLISIGSPDLKLMEPLGVNLQWVSAHSWGNIFWNNGYENTAHAIVTDCIYDADRDLFVQSFYSGGHFENLRSLLGVDWNVIPDRLRLSTMLNYEYSRLPGIVTKSKGGFCGGGSVTYMQGGFSGKIEVTSQKSIMTRSGLFLRSPLWTDVSLGYAVDGWSINLMARNPFMKVRSIVWEEYGGLSNRIETYSPKHDYNSFSIKVSYRFNYGKKHKFEDVNLDDAPKSAIL